MRASPREQARPTAAERVIGGRAGISRPLAIGRRPNAAGLQGIGTFKNGDLTFDRSGSVDQP